ncbi:hypothetical protein [Nocardia brasiliensis]|uniref:hypothetical protein n=1 Tax=Nocardia brasiliensis TaxID=37326 RepID=UPI002455B4A5|nr:hypothetical protein [Nocardia brasiliensis]
MAAIQTAVDLLGRRNPSPPPRVAELLQPREYRNPGNSAATTDYLGELATVGARRSSLLTMDQQVAATSVVVAAGQNQTMRLIQGDVADLKAKLRAAEPGLLAADSDKSRAALEAPLMREISATVQQVYQRVSSTYHMNTQIAGTSNGSGQMPSSATGAGGAPSGGGGPDILSSLLPLLAVIPMAATPLLSMVPELLRQHESAQAEGDKKGEPGKPASPNATPNTLHRPDNPAIPPAGSVASPAPGTSPPGSAPTPSGQSPSAHPPDFRV